MKMKTITIAMLMGLTTASIAHACTSVAWNTEHGTFTSRTNDWVESTSPTLGGVLKGEMRSLQGTRESDKYRVKYDFVAVLAYGELMHDGVNSEGFQVNSLFYNPMSMPEAKEGVSSISQFTFGEYLLASFASVDEAIKALPSLKLGKITLERMPMEMNIHWSITDKSGDRAVIELDKDGINIYRGEEAMVMTNDPSMKIHITNRENSKRTWVNSNSKTEFGSTGNTNAESRFLHASYYKSKLIEPSSINNGLMKLSTVPFRVPVDAPYKDFGRGMTGYATEWTLTQSLESGDSVFEYNFDDNWNTVKYNVYDMMGKTFRIDLTQGKFSQLQY